MTKLQDFLQTLRDRLPLSVVVARHVAIKKKGREFTGLCPFHNEKGASFSVNDEKAFYHCFGCGAHGDLFDFVMQKLNMPFMDAVDYLATQAGLTVPRFEAKEGSDPAQQGSQDDQTTLFELNDKVCQWFQAQLRTPEAEFVRTYLKRRGMTGQMAKQFRIGFAPERGLKEYLLGLGYNLGQLLTLGLVVEPESGRSPYDRFRQRVMFPIQDRRGRVIAFGGRILDQGEPKYLNSPDTPLFNKGRQLYALNHALISARAGQPFVVVEGYMDVIAMHQAGLTTAVAPLGTALTPEQIALMWRSHARPILCFDGDSAGRRAAHRAAQRAMESVKPGYTLDFCFLPEGEDPDSFLLKGSVNQFRDLLNRPTPLVDVLWQVFMDGRQVQNPEQKSKARQDLLQFTNVIQDPETRHFYRDDLNQRLQNVLNEQKRKNFTPQVNLLNRGMKPNQENKVEKGQKILLATLINHPTLVTEVAEQLMSLRLESEKFDSLRHFLLDLFASNPHISTTDLTETLRSNDFGEVIDVLLTRDLYSKARFSHPSAPLDQVREGWHEIWRSLETQSQIRQEVRETSTELKESLDENSWQRLKLLKTSLAIAKAN